MNYIIFTECDAALILSSFYELYSKKAEQKYISEISSYFNFSRNSLEWEEIEWKVQSTRTEIYIQMLQTSNSV